MTSLLRRHFAIPSRSLLGVAVFLLGAIGVQRLLGAIPWSGALPLELHLLPSACVVFVGVYCLGAGAGIVISVGLAAAGLLAGESGVDGLVAQQAISLVPFALLSALAIARWPAMRWSAALAWLVSAAVVATSTWMAGGFGDGRSTLESIVAAWAASMPGVVALVGLNFALVALLPKDIDWDAT